MVLFVVDGGDVQFFGGGTLVVEGGFCGCMRFGKILIWVPHFWQILAISVVEKRGDVK